MALVRLLPVLQHLTSLRQEVVESYRRRAAYAAATSLSDIEDDRDKQQPEKEIATAKDNSRPATLSSDIET